MVSLGASLSIVGISQAKGSDLVALRDQIAAAAALRKAAAAQKQPTATDLTPEQQQQVAKLQQVDRTVRDHEAAHMRAGRELITSGPNYTYTYGPDGKRYAVGGEVGIDTTAETKPQENIDKGIRIQAAALAPADPSPQDYRVASVGGELEARGRTDLATEQRAAEADKAAQKANGQPVSTPSAQAGSADSTRQRLAQVYGATIAAGAAGGGFSAFA